MRRSLFGTLTVELALRFHRMGRLLPAVARPSPTSLDRSSAPLVFVLALFWFASLAWMRPLSIPDEGRYVGVAWEMLRSGDWVTPTLDGLPFLHKPPLFYWITAAAMNVFGSNQWAVRSASVLAASATVSIVYGVCREWLNEASARRAAAVLATIPLFYGGAQFANMDMLVAACISAAILFGARTALRIEAGRQTPVGFTAAYVAAALGIMAKGLIGLVIPALVLLTWLALARQWRILRALCFWRPGLAIFAVIVAPWFVAVELKQPAFFHYFFIVQHFQRFAQTGFNNVQPVWFYLPVLLVFALPWSAWLFTTLRRVQEARPATAGMSLLPRVTALMWIWLFVVVIFFSIPQSKPIGYALPALPPLAVIVALTAAPLLEGSARAAALWRYGCLAATGICVVAAVAFALVHPKSSRELSERLVASGLPQGGIAFIDEYRYDVAFYLHATGPVFVVTNWDRQDVRRQDNWRKELADAGGYAPALATDRLLDAARFRSALCSGRIRWILAHLSSIGPYPFLTSVLQVAVERDSALWYVDVTDPRVAAAVGCADPLPGRGSGFP